MTLSFIAGLLLAGWGCGIEDETALTTTMAKEPLSKTGAQGGKFRFVRNDGQWDVPARFVLRRGLTTARLAPGEIGLQIEERKGNQIEGAYLRMAFEGASESAEIVGEELLPGRNNYFIGRDRATWRSQVPGFARVRYQGLYPGVDVVVRGHEGHLEYDVIASPGSDLSDVVIRCEGAEKLSLTGDGSLRIDTPMGPLIQPAPRTWTENTIGERTPVPCRYRILGDRHYSFTVDGRRLDEVLVIDPGLIWASRLGDRGLDTLYATAFVQNGDVVVAGIAGSFFFPTTPGAYDTAYGDVAAYLTRFDSSGSNLVFSTYFGGSSAALIGSILPEEDGNILISGYTQSADFPVTPGAFDETYGGLSAGFLTRFKGDGSALLHSTLIHGSGSSGLGDIAKTPDGLIVVAAGSNSTDFPTTPNAYDQTLNDTGPFFLGDGAIVIFEADLSALRYSTFLGGSDNESLTGLDVDAAGNILVAGATGSPNFPITPGAFDSTQGHPDAFVGWMARLDAPWSTLRFSTYLSGSGINESVVTDARFAPDGSAVGVGYTNSPDFPTTPGVLDGTFDGGEGFGRDGFAVKLDVNGNAVYSTYLGGSGNDEPRAVRVDSIGAAIVTGNTKSPDFPMSPGGYQPTSADATPNTGARDSFLTRLAPDGSRVLYSTYFGGESSDELAADLDLSGDHTVVIAGTTLGRNFPATEGAYDTRPPADGSIDAFAAVLSLGPTVMIEGTPSGGTAVRFVVESAPLSAAGHMAQVLLSCSGTAGIDLPTTQENLPLTLDLCTQLSLTFAPLLRGTLDPMGRTETPWVTLPAGIPAGVGVHAAAFTWSPATAVISSVSCPLSFQTQ